MYFEENNLRENTLYSMIQKEWKHGSVISKYSKLSSYFSYIYVIRSGDFFKIGRTFNYKKRLSSIAGYTVNFGLILLYRVVCACIIEKNLHRYFS